MIDVPPPPGPEAEAMRRLYGRRFSDRERREKHQIWGVIVDQVLSQHVPPEGAVLDLGAGDCDIINQVRARRKVAVDINPDVRLAAAPGVEVHVASFAELPNLVSPGSIDTVVASNVFEHLPSPAALLEVLAAVRTVLAPGGRLLILQPNVRLVGGEFWDFFDHTLPLTERGMAEALALAGFRVLKCRAGLLPYTTKSVLPKWPLLVRMYLALPPAQWLLGKQMFIVAERPR